jgi:hypothetical protein
MFQLNEPQTGRRIRWPTGTCCLLIRFASVFGIQNVPNATEAHYSDTTGRLRALEVDLVEDVSAVDERRIATEGNRREWVRGRFWRL